MTQELHPDAQLELLEAAHWYAERSVQAGGNFVTAMNLPLESFLKTRDGSRGSAA